MQQQDLDAAMEGFSSAAAWGLGQGPPSSSVTGWQDVGGMEAAKGVLQEALELPTKFASLLSKQVNLPAVIFFCRMLINMDLKK